MKNIFSLITFYFFAISTSTFAQSNACISNQSFKIVILGSSTAAGAGVSVSDSAWVNRYRKHIQSINPNNEVVNLAVGGYNTYKIMPSNFTQPTGRPAPDTNRNITTAISLEADAIIINMPSNDVASGFSVAEQLNNFDTIVNLAYDNNIPIWVCTTQPRNFGNTSYPLLQAEVRDSINVKYFPNNVDFWNPFALANNSLDPIYDSGDGVHMNDTAHYLMANKIIDLNILDQIFTAPSYTDLSLIEIKDISKNVCGSAQHQFYLSYINLGEPDSSNMSITMELHHIESGNTFVIDSFFNNENASCFLDTIFFEENTILQGNYKLKCFLNNTNDSIFFNDTLNYNFEILGTPSIAIVSDTLCQQESTILEAFSENNDLIYWYNNLNDSLPALIGNDFTTPILTTSTSYFAQSIRGDLFYKNDLTTTNTSNVNWNGTMFNIVAYEDIILDSLAMKIFSTGTQGVEVYYKNGSYQGSQLLASDWTLHSSTTVNVMDSLAFTTVPISSLSVLTNDTIGFYIHMTNSSSRLSYNNSGSELSVHSPELSILTGSGISHNFSAEYFPRNWNGQIFYHFGNRLLGQCHSEKEEVFVELRENDFTLGIDTIIDIDDTLNLSAPENMLAYDWSIGESTQEINIAGNEIGEGIHIISVDVIDSFLCSYSDTLILGVAKLATNVSSSKDYDFKLYPNPTKGIVYFNNYAFKQVQITTLDGKSIIKNIEQKSSLDLSFLEKGIYFLKFIDEDNFYYTKLLLK